MCLNVLKLFLKFLEVFGPIRTQSDPFECFRMHSDAFGNKWRVSDNIGFFELFCNTADGHPQSWSAKGPATKPLQVMVGCANGNCPGCRIKRDPHSSKEADCSGDGFDHYEE